MIEKVTLNCVKTIKLLILNRSKLDELFNVKIDYNNHPFVCNGIIKLNEDIICLYADLEQLIIETPMKKYQREIIYLLMEDYSNQDIRDIINQKYDIDIPDITGNFLNACERLYKINKIKIQDCIEISALAKIPSKIKYKQCRKCYRWLRTQYYYMDIINKDGLKNRCHLCI